jgi:lysophospholipase L1-like esterase
VVFNDAVVGCTLPWGVSRPLEGAPEITYYPPCDAHWRTVVQRFQPDVVLVVLQCCSSEHRFGDTWLQPCDPRYAEIFDRSFRNLVRRVGKSGAHVVITTSPYTLKETLGPPYLKNLDCSNELRKKVAGELGVQLVDLGAWTCPEPPYCRTEEDGVTLRPDRVHFEGEGAHIASRWLLDQLPAASRFTSTG